MKTCLMPGRLESICSTVSSLRDSSLKDGSPILVVPPPISAIGRCPVFCIQRSIMIWTSDPACRLVAVASNPMYPVIRARHGCGIQAFGIGDLVDESTLRQDIEEFGLERAHARLLGKRVGALTTGAACVKTADSAWAHVRDITRRYRRGVGAKRRRRPWSSADRRAPMAIGPDQQALLRTAIADAVTLERPQRPAGAPGGGRARADRLACAGR